MDASNLIDLSQRRASVQCVGLKSFPSGLREVLLVTCGCVRYNEIIVAIIVIRYFCLTKVYVDRATINIKDSLGLANNRHRCPNIQRLHLVRHRLKIDHFPRFGIVNALLQPNAILRVYLFFTQLYLICGIDSTLIIVEKFGNSS